MAQICVLASQTFRKAQNLWDFPAPSGQAGAQPVPGEESAVTNLGARGAMEATPRERGLNPPIASTPHPSHTLLGGRSIVWKEQARHRGLSSRTVSGWKSVVALCLSDLCT